MSAIGLVPVLVMLALLAPGTGSAAQAATPCADLLVDAVASSPAQPVVGLPSTINITVRNAGTCASGAFVVQWRSDILSAAQPTVPVSDLGPGASTTVSVPFVFPRSGLFVSFATADPANAVAETNEGNNVTTKVMSAASGADLVVSTLSINPAAPAQGQQANVSVKVTNQGVTPAGAFRVDWTPAFAAPAISQQVSGLGAGASTTLVIPYTYSSAGSFLSAATVDAGGTVAEANEFNNTTYLGVTVVPILPDLVVTSAAFDPSQPFPSTVVAATITVKNNGLAAAGPFKVQWQPWILANPLSTTVSGLAPGESTSVTFPYVFPWVGGFDGTATVDSASAVAEIDETNNSRSTHVDAVQPTLDPVRIAQNGIDNDPHNVYSWSMAWFKGKLYVGTARDEQCVEAITADFYYPGYYTTPLQGFPELPCAADRYDLDLRAEIWQYTPETQTWKQVYQSPTIPNPREQGKTIARDIAYRGMVVYTDPSTGQEALYVAGLTADEYVPENAEAYPPRILRTTDGETFTPLPTGPGLIHNTFGAQRPVGIRSMLVYNNRLLVTASGGLTGDGVVLEVKDPAGPSPQWVQVSPDTMQIFEMENFNGTVYIGNASNVTGYSVWKATDTSTTPFTFTPVVSNGAGRGSAITSVVSMHVFKGRLYVGSSGWGGVFPNSELIRINPDDTWDVVTGATRTADGATKAPISGLGDGFGNIWNAHFWRMQDLNGVLYVGTNDASWGLRATEPFATLYRSEFGFDVWGSCDGQYWFAVTHNGFGDGQWNFGARTMVSTPLGMFIGTANHVQGTSVWLGNASPCGSGGGGQFGLNQPSAAAGSSSGTTSDAGASAHATTPPQPTRLLTDAQPCGTSLTWDAAPGVTSYRILRADYRSATMDTKLSAELRAAYAPDLVPTSPTPGVARSKSQRIWIPTPYREIGSTTKSSFVDRTAVAGKRYDYEVVAVNAAGVASAPSNVAAVPSQTLDATFDQLTSAIRRLNVAQGSGHGTNLVRLTTTLRAKWNAGTTASMQALAALRSAVAATSGRSSGARATAAAGDVQDALFRLEHRASARPTCKG